MPFFKPFSLERFFDKHEFSAKYLLCSSDCESVATADILALEPGAQEKFLAQRLGYTETRGEPGLRKAIASLYAETGRKGQGSIPFGNENIIVHSGAEEAILNLYLAMLKPGDRVIVNFPCYQSLSEIPRALGCEVIPWPLQQVPKSGIKNEGTRWTLDPAQLPRLAQDKAKLIVLNMPHNPSGALLTKSEFDAIVDYARKIGAIVLVDEVYRRLEHDPSRLLPSIAEAYENGVALDVLSKHAGLAGLRIGWLASRRTDILDSVAMIKDYNSICSSAPSEVLAGIAVRNLGKLVARNRTIIEGNMKLLRAFFSGYPDFAAWTEPEGGSIAFPCLAGGKGGSDAETMAGRLVAESGVLLLPGKYYGYDESYFRLGYGRANMGEALSRLETWIKKH